jgi:hydroxyacylglutathione hydrolase
VTSTPVVSVADLGNLLAEGQPTTVLDVRHSNEWRSGHIPGSVHIALPDLHEQARSLLSAREPVAVHCAGSYRSGMAVSILERLDFSSVYHVLGGFDAWRAAGCAVAHPLISAQ